VVLHFGMHGALEFMPGKQAGLGARDWPDRLIGEMPNVYLYAVQQPVRGDAGQAPLERGDDHASDPAAGASGLYKGLRS
jgi:magnesium chelatase subunit H